MIIITLLYLIGKIQSYQILGKSTKINLNMRYNEVLDHCIDDRIRRKFEMRDLN